MTLEEAIKKIEEKIEDYLKIKGENEFDSYHQEIKKTHASGIIAGLNIALDILTEIKQGENHVI